MPEKMDFCTDQFSSVSYSPMKSTRKLIECPRDAMQGWNDFIPTDKKIEYINALLQVGFDTIDFGSFVSAKAIPQMADTKEVLSQLETGNTNSKLLAIVANTRGAEEASVFEQISYLGFPFSVSETFQRRNTNSSIEESFTRVEEINSICVNSNRQLVVYMSMGFGNPYGDPYSEQIVFEWVNRIAALGVNIISLADTVGLATPEQVFRITDYLVKKAPELEIGVHLHSAPGNWKEKIDAAIRAGCSRFDGALKGIGGCPMANDELVGNMNTELLIAYFERLGIANKLNKEALLESLRIAEEIFIQPQ
jgi:hydroxymethylglutaryl-CoA lyase